MKVEMITDSNDNKLGNFQHSNREMECRIMYKLYHDESSAVAYARDRHRSFNFTKKSLS